MLFQHWNNLHPFVVEDTSDRLPESIHPIMQWILELVDIDRCLLLKNAKTKWDTDLNRGSYHCYECGYPHVWMPCVKCRPFQSVMQHLKVLSWQLNILILMIRMKCRKLISEHNVKRYLLWGCRFSDNIISRSDAGSKTIAQLSIWQVPCLFNIV